MTALLLSLVLSLSPLHAEEVSFQAEDGTEVHGDFQATSREPHRGAVLLVHGEGRHASDWQFLARRLNRGGFDTLAIELREPPGGDEPWTPLLLDVKAGLAYLHEHGPVSVVGADVGANLVLLAAAEDAEVANAVLLSPGVNLHGLKTSEAIAAYGERPLLIAVSSEDRYAAKSALFLDSQARGEHHLAIFEGAGHGATMLNREPSLEPLVLSWLQGVYELESRVDSSLEIQENSSPIETTGPKPPWLQ